MFYKNYTCLFLLVIFSSLAADSATTDTMEVTAKPLNILILYADDWRHDTLGVAGHPIVQTPNLDKLAEEGVRFTNNYVTSSVCGVSRASLYTGQWLSRHQSGSFGMWKTPWSETYPGILREHGYYVGHIGKWHNGKFPQDKYDFGRAYSGRHWYESRGEQHIHVTQRNELDALEFLQERPKDKPFVLTLAFFATHAEDGHPLQFLPQPESLSLYEDAEIPLPVTATPEAWEKLPDFFTEANEGRNRWHWRFDNPVKYQYMMKNYYRLASEVDATCGRILQELEAQGVLEHTLVIFTTDNGYFHGEHGLADKWYPHEESIRVPLIIRDPRRHESQAHQIQEEMTLNVDLAPTLLTAVGISPPETMQGRDLAPLYLKSDNSGWRKEYFYEHPTIIGADFIPASQALVRSDWKYFYWPDHGVEQLFHLETDPHEEHDLASKPEHQNKLLEMRNRFAKLKVEAK